MSRSSLDSRVQERALREHLGPPIGPPIALGPRPLRFDPVSVVLLGIAFGLLAIALRLGSIVLFGALTAALAAGAAALLVLRRSRRALLTPFERGLAFESRGRKRTFLLHDLQSLELRERDVPGGLVRRIALTDGNGRVRFEQFAGRKEEDRLGGFLVHLLAHLIEIAEKKTISGRDWVLGPDGLSAPAHEHPVPLAEISAVTVRQHRVAVWRPHERFPFFVVPDDSPNAVVLVALLSRF